MSAGSDKELAQIGALLDLMPTGFVLHHLHGIRQVNDTAAAMLGQPADALTGKNLLDFLDEGDKDLLSPDFFSLFRNGAAITVPEVTLAGEEGAVKVVRLVGNQLSGQGDDTLVQFLLQDVHADAGQGDRDPATGLYNRRQFIDRISNEVRRAIRFDDELAVILLKISNFQQILDTLGQNSGHRILRQLSTLLHESLRETDSFDAMEDSSDPAAGRFNLTHADQFGIIMPRTGDDGTGLVATRLAEQVSAHQFTLDGRVVDVTLAIGYAVLDPDDLHYQDLMARAEAALSKAEEQGKTAVVSGESLRSLF